MTSVLLGAFIFGYAGWMLFRFVKRSKKGACASCPVQTSCANKECHAIDNDHKAD